MVNGVELPTSSKYLERLFTCHQRAQTVVAFHPSLQPIFITAGATPALAQARAASRDSPARAPAQLPCTSNTCSIFCLAAALLVSRSTDGRAEGGESETSRSGPRWRFPQVTCLSVCLCLSSSPRLLVSLLMAKLHVKVPCRAQPSLLHMGSGALLLVAASAASNGTL